MKTNMQTMEGYSNLAYLVLVNVLVVTLVLLSL